MTAKERRAARRFYTELKKKQRVAASKSRHYFYKYYEVGAGASIHLRRWSDSNVKVYHKRKAAKAVRRANDIYQRAVYKRLYELKWELC